MAEASLDCSIVIIFFLSLLTEIHEIKHLILLKNIKIYPVQLFNTERLATEMKYTV